MLFLKLLFMKKMMLLNLIILSISGCTAIADSPGTLGATAIHELNCPESNLQYELDRLIETDRFKTSIQDTNTIDWWQRAGYDFLNYKCLTINKVLYMVTINC